MSWVICVNVIVSFRLLLHPCCLVEGKNSWLLGLYFVSSVRKDLSWLLTSQGPWWAWSVGKSLTFWTLQLLGWSCPLGNIFMGHSSSMWVLFAEGSWLNCQKSDTSRAPRCKGVEVTLRPRSSQTSWKKIKYLSDTTCKVSTDRRL